MSNNEPKKDENLKDNDALLAKTKQQGEALDDDALDQVAGGYIGAIKQNNYGHMI